MPRLPSPFRIQLHLATVLASGLLMAAVGAAAGRMAAPAVTLRHRPLTDLPCPLKPATTLTAAGSPYRVTCDLAVPKGDTLTIQPGVELRFGAFFKLDVSGALKAVGTAEQPVRLVADVDAEPWASVNLLAGSGPSEVAFAEFRGGGARRKEMLGIASSAALVRDSLFTGGAGTAIEIKDGVSPTVQGSIFRAVSNQQSTPPAALRILGTSEAVITGNYFESNDTYGAYWEANATPKFTLNRFAYNGRDGVLVYGDIARPVTLASLGPRKWAYHVSRTGLKVLPAGKLTIEAGSTLRFDTGVGIRVQGTLQVKGTAFGHVLFAAQPPREEPGQWLEIRFEDSAADFDARNGSGSFIEHAEIENSGSNRTGAVYIQNSSPRIANTTIRRSRLRGMTVTGPNAKPELVGNTFREMANDPDGVGLAIAEGALPAVSSSRFTSDFIGVLVEGATSPRIGPHNRFDGLATYGVNNVGTGCADAIGNDWGAPDGPDDPSDALDICRLEQANPGKGALVSDSVRYGPFEGQLARPTFTSPGCGSVKAAQPTVKGYAAAGSTVHVYDNQKEIGTAAADAGDGTFGTFSFLAPALGAGSHVLQLRAELGSQSSGMSDPLELLVDPALAVDPAGMRVQYTLDGTTFVQPYRDASGCLVLRGDGSWSVQAHPGKPLTFTASLACPNSAAPQAKLLYLGQAIPLAANGDGSSSASFEMGNGGPFSLEITCGAAKSELLLGTIAVEYDGFIYDVFGQPEPFLARIKDAKVTLQFKDPAAPVDRQWRLWPAAEFAGQTNPQITGLGGWYAFYPPAGEYRLQVEAPGGFIPYTGGAFHVTTEPVVQTIGLGKPPTPTPTPTATPRPTPAGIYLPKLVGGK